MRSTVGFIVTLLTLSLAGCAPAPPEPEAAPAEPVEAPAEPGVITVVADDYSFTAPPTFPSGWVKLRFENRGAEPHFLFMQRLVEGRTFDDYAQDVGQPFSELYVRYRAGEMAQEVFLEQLAAAVPEWFVTLPRVGGPGFTAPGATSETTVYLEPGDYVMECYVRTMTASDTFHGDHGMLRPLIVTAEPSGLEPPEADVRIALSNYALAVEGELTAGSHVAAVTVEEAPEGLIQHNVHLAKLDGETSAADVAQWLDWIDHMLPPAPAHFVGGAGQASPGTTSYFSFDLEPGRYAWVSEAWGVQGMVHEFTVE